MVNVWVGGVIPDQAEKYFHAQGDFELFCAWMYPTLGNVTIFFTPGIGALIDRYGFALVGALLIFSTQCCIALLMVNSEVAQYGMLVCFNFLQAAAYTVEFAYLQLTFPQEIFSQLLALTLLVQALVGFVAWPGLATADPLMGAVICLLPLFFLYAWPLSEACCGGSAISRTRGSESVGLTQA